MCIERFSSNIVWLPFWELRVPGERFRRQQTFRKFWTRVAEITTAIVSFSVATRPANGVDKTAFEDGLLGLDIDSQFVSGLYLIGIFAGKTSRSWDLWYSKNRDFRAANNSAEVCTAAMGFHWMTVLYWAAFLIFQPVFVICDETRLVTFFWEKLYRQVSVISTKVCCNKIRNTQCVMRCAILRRGSENWQQFETTFIVNVGAMLRRFEFGE